jgi:hypothetical protein
MPSDEHYERSFHFGPVESRGVVGALRLGQAAALGVGASTAVIVFRQAPNGLGFAASIALLVAAAGFAFGCWRGRTLEEWLPVVTRWTLLKRSGGHRYRSVRPGVGTTLTFGRGRTPEPPALPPLLEGCRLLDVPVADGPTWA